MASNIGILGGTFNPIHFGHLRIAEALAESLQFDEVRFIPSANPPHKIEPKTSATDRAHMVKVAIEDNPLFKLDTIELERTGASYTIDTLISLREQLGKTTSLNLIMGSDAFVHLESWQHWEAIIEYCNIVLVQRPQAPTETQQPKLSKVLEQFLSEYYSDDPTALKDTPNGFVHMQTVTPLTISSTDIRARVNKQQSIRYLTPQSVIDTINTKQFYLS
jgi:nicotinate-nucleotide adenylyltransferase